MDSNFIRSYLGQDLQDMQDFFAEGDWDSRLSSGKPGK
jgi:hypothetical protein